MAPEAKTKAPEPRQAPAPLVEPGSQAFKIQVFSREHPIQEGASFAFDDRDYGDLAHGDLMAMVTVAEQPEPRGQLRLEWSIDGVVWDRRSAKLDHMLEFGNEPIAGNYVVTLYYKERSAKEHVVKTFTFRISK
jgi:hypothetical protein